MGFECVPPFGKAAVDDEHFNAALIRDRDNCIGGPVLDLNDFVLIAVQFGDANIMIHFFRGHIIWPHNNRRAVIKVELPKLDHDHSTIVGPGRMGRLRRVAHICTSRKITVFILKSAF